MTKRGGVFFPLYLRRFIEYFRDTWMDCIDWWRLHEGDGIVTNGGAEVFHRDLKAKFNHAHPGWETLSPELLVFDRERLRKNGFAPPYNPLQHVGPRRRAVMRGKERIRARLVQWTVQLRINGAGESIALKTMEDFLNQASTPEEEEIMRKEAEAYFEENKEPTEKDEEDFRRETELARARPSAGKDRGHGDGVPFGEWATSKEAADDAANAFEWIVGWYMAFAERNGTGNQLMDLMVDEADMPDPLEEIDCDCGDLGLAKMILHVESPDTGPE
jgi:hypothetical protein